MTNTGAAAIYFTTNGVAAVVGGVDNFEVSPGQSELVANMLPLWTQAANVIGNTASYAPNQDQYGTEIYGGAANQGMSVSIISSATPTFTVSAAG